MRKKIMYLLSVVLASSMLLANVLFVNAAGMDVVHEINAVDSSVMPRLNSVIMDGYDFAISDAGEACVSAWYSAESSSFKLAKLTVKIQKKVLGLFWKTVDIGEVDNQWTVYSSNVNEVFNYYVDLEDTGTYRAVITLEITTISGSVDEIEETIECKYE